jgi:hypothetical protein
MIVNNNVIICGRKHNSKSENMNFIVDRFLFLSVIIGAVFL